MAGPAAEPWNGRKGSSINVLVGSSASRPYVDDAFIPRLRYKLAKYQASDAPREITIAEGHRLGGVARGLLRGYVIDGDGPRRLFQIYCMVVCGLGCKLFSVK